METCDFLLEKRLKELDPDLHQRFTDTVFVLQGMLIRFKNYFPEYTDHSEFHCMNVVNFCNNLIGTEQIKRMSACEIYVLLMSCYLHDVGMALTPDDYDEFRTEMNEEEYFQLWPDKDVADFIRDNHHEFSALFIRKYADLLEIPSEEFLFAVVQTCRGHRRTDLFDKKEYPDVLKIPGQGEVHLPYLSALIRLADEIDVVADRNPKLLYDIEALTDELQIAHNRLLAAVPNMTILPERFVLDVRTDDQMVWLAVEKMAGKMQMTLDYCRGVAEACTPYRISQKLVQLHRI